MTGEVGQQDVVLILDTQSSAVVFPAIAEGRVSVRAVLDQNSGTILRNHRFVGRVCQIWSKTKCMLG